MFSSINRDRSLLSRYQSNDRFLSWNLLAGLLEIHRSHLPHGDIGGMQQFLTINTTALQLRATLSSFSSFSFSSSAYKKGIIGYGLWDYKPLEYDGYIYPTWANVLGWCIAGSSIAMIPTVAVYQILITPGTFCQVYTLRSRYTIQSSH